ncbi:hypothetical protein ANN_04078 [Periplaneta americana]|uniref:Uncharacterized protein n=1 Tax=Periplaneta americana TaxID=6978 RepID=A0ABQ8T9D7_PERAM|nr:hypothetical protein ANN_04078 [Periplaneta americana]
MLAYNKLNYLKMYAILQVANRSRFYLTTTTTTTTTTATTITSVCMWGTLFLLQKDPPSRNTIKTWKQHFLATGSVVKLHGGGNVRVSEERVAAVRQAYERSPRKSVRQAGRELQMPKSTEEFVHPSLTGRPSFLGSTGKIPSTTNESEPRARNLTPLESRSASETRTTP